MNIIHLYPIAIIVKSHKLTPYLECSKLYALHLKYLYYNIYYTVIGLRQQRVLQNSKNM